MGQPNPPGDIPLIDGLGSEWNEFVSAIPEEKRAEFGPKLKERISAYEPLKQWEDLHKSGITPEHASTALSIYTVLENNPREVYDTLAKHLGITPQQAQQVVEEIEEGDEDDPRIKRMQQQIDTLSQIALAENQRESEARRVQEQEEALDKEMTALKKKHGDFPEDEIIMRMMYNNISAEQAYQEYSGRISEIQKRRPSPMILGSGGAVPPQAIDPRKLSDAETKNLVADMFRHANQESRRS